MSLLQLRLVSLHAFWAALAMSAPIVLLSFRRWIKGNEEAEEKKRRLTNELIFLGSGPSSGTPYIYHVMDGAKGGSEVDMRNAPQSALANQGDPRYNRNYRCNTSVLFRLGSSGKSLLVDCGKTFREGAVRWFPNFKIASIDSVILTHGHADAIFGIDELRSTQPKDQLKPLPIWQSDECEEVTKRAFPYLYPADVEPLVKRFVASIEWKQIRAFEAFSPLPGLSVLPIPVPHGEDMNCLGFLFRGTSVEEKESSGQEEGEVVLYFSDISRMPDEIYAFIEKNTARVDVLVIDALHPTAHYPTHISLNEAKEISKRIVPRPKRVLFVGTNTCIEHYSENKKLLREFGYVKGSNTDAYMSLAYDGQAVLLAM